MWRYRKLSEEKKKELIERIAQKIVEHEMDVPAYVFLSGLRPMSIIAGQMGILFAGPYLEMFGQDAYDVLSFLESPKNVKRLLEKLENIREDKQEKKEIMEKKEKKSLLERIKSYFS